MSTHKEVIDLIKNLTGQANVLTVPRIFVDYIGSLDAALFLSQVIYWSDKTNDPEGWFFKTYAEWQEEICLSEYEVRKAVKKLIDLGYLDTKVKKANGNPTVHYRLNFDTFSVSFLEFLKERKQRNSRNVPLESEQSLTENTTKTTAENKESVPEKGVPENSEQRDYLNDVFQMQGHVNEVTADYPEDQFWVFRDEFLNLFKQRMERDPNQTEKEEIVTLANDPLAKRNIWDISLKECILNWTGRGTPPLSRIIEVYKFGGDYEKWRRWKYNVGHAVSDDIPDQEPVKYVAYDRRTGEKLL